MSSPVLRQSRLVGSPGRHWTTAVPKGGPNCWRSLMSRSVSYPVAGGGVCLGLTAAALLLTYTTRDPVLLIPSAVAAALGFCLLLIWGWHMVDPARPRGHRLLALSPAVAPLVAVV